jgi:hypothetical protein
LTRLEEAAAFARALVAGARKQEAGV